MSKYLGGILHLGTVHIDFNNHSVVANEEQEKILLSLCNKLEKEEDIKQILINVYDDGDDWLYKNIVAKTVIWDDRSVSIMFELEDMNTVETTETTITIHSRRFECYKDFGANQIIWNTQDNLATLQKME